jgi:hypothetical protein
MATSNMTDEPYYTSEQISIPSEFPDILLQFSKAAIRTQPSDVLAWSAAYVVFSNLTHILILFQNRYFRALANGQTPPVKERTKDNLENIYSIL